MLEMGQVYVRDKLGDHQKCDQHQLIISIYDARYFQLFSTQYKYRKSLDRQPKLLVSNYYDSIRNGF